MDKDYLIRLIFEYNPHLAGKPTVVLPFRRSLYREIKPWLTKKQAIAITGLRRTGKTTLLRQLMNEAPEKAVFFSFDEEEVQKKEVLVFVLDYALNALEATWIFLDEIQYVQDWEGTIKRYYDQKGCKFVVSGSESMEIDKGNAGLAGRLITFRLNPLNFREYLGLKGRDIEPKTIDIDDFSAFQEVYLKYITQKEYFEKEFIDYLWKGAFPELVQEDDSGIVRKYIYDLVVRKILYRDIPAIFEIRRKDLLYDLFRYSCSTSSGLFDISNLAKMFKANSETVTNYLFYLRSAFLVHVAESYSGSSATRMRRNKKLYVIHPAIACAVLGLDRTHLLPQVIGPYVETLFFGDYFWRDKEKHEVDVVITKPRLIPVEIKYQNQITDTDTKNIRIFMDQFKLSKGIIVTKNMFDLIIYEEKELLFIPAWAYLLVKS